MLARKPHYHQLIIHSLLREAGGRRRPYRLRLMKAGSSPSALAIMAYVGCARITLIVLRVADGESIANAGIIVNSYLFKIVI